MGFVEVFAKFQCEKKKSEVLKMHYIYEYKSPIGDITMASDGTSLIGLWFNGQKYFASDDKE